MQVKIFYSWQSDSAKKYNRYFIEDCVNRAIKKLKLDFEVHVEWNLDRDTKGELGTIDIVQTILKKIDECHIFIADITLINEKGQKRTPNPNVLFELGYAVTKVGWTNVITVFNESYGRVEDLPFDLRFRRPAIYNYNEDTKSDNVVKIREEFVDMIKNYINKTNPSIVNQLRRLEVEFSEESTEAKRLVLDKPDLWVERLIRRP